MSEIITKEINIGNKHFGRIIPIGDIHIDAPTWDEEFFDSIMKWIYENKDVHVIGMGDYLDLATLKSPTNVHEQKGNTNHQIKILLKYFKPLAKEKRLVGMLLGNHEYRLNRYAGLDIIELVCDILQVPYMGLGEFIQFNIKKNSYREKYIFYASHGSSGAYTKGGKINSMYRAAIPFGAEVYLFGHTHDLSTNKENRYIIENGKRKMIEMHIVNTGHFLKYWGSYAQMKGYSVGNPGAPKIKLHATKHRVSVHI